MKRLISIIASGAVAILSALACSCPSHAQEQAGSLSSSDIIPRHISMGVGKSVVVDLPEEAAEIFVANPKVANALVRSPQKLYLIGESAGQTTVLALDHEGRKIAAFELSIGRDIGELQQILRAAMPSTAIVARTVNDTIILTGTVDSAEEAQKACDIAQGFVQRVYADSTSGGGPGGSAQRPNAPSGSTGCAGGYVINTLTIRGRTQVMLKVTVAEVNRDVLKQLGVTASPLTASWGTFTQFNPLALNGVIASTPLVPSVSPLATAAQNGTATELTAHNPDNTLSATLQAFERYGVTRILAEPSVSAVSGRRRGPGSRPAELLSRPRGLLHHHNRLQGLWCRFEIRPRSRDYQRQETELMIVVTPYFVKPTRPNEIAKPTDGFADASDPQTWLLGRINQLYASPSNHEAIQDYRGPVGFIQD